jgi:1,4-alpha-glucan branching enzyme
MDELQSYLFREGNCAYAYQFMGAHPVKGGYAFAVWAPEAKQVSVVGDFNGWDHTRNPMQNQGGVWTASVPGVKQYASYKYAILGPSGGWAMKADPYAFHAETRPKTASKTFDVTKYRWKDKKWMAARAGYHPYSSPISIYEMHLGSWKLDEEGRLYTYERMADEIVPYIKDMGYTHVELLPVMEHPFDGSWGYQVTGYFAATSRFGDPAGLMKLIDAFHQAGIGVILDWVPAHFPKDAHGLYRFDGAPLYENADPRRGENEQWGTCMFDFGRNEVRSFLKSSAVFWLDVFHADGLRVDAVSYMLYHDYGRAEGKWLPNQYGGRENLEAISLLREINEIAYRDFPGILMCAEEATSYPLVTAPTAQGGLGFGFKWNMGWMHDVLDYMEMDPIFRKYHHDKMTFSLFYAFSENYILPFSHDEVVHGKKSMLDKMPGDIWQKFASLRALFGFMFAHPGKKLMFMGAEFGQFIEWKELEQLDWFLLLYEKHPDMKKYVRDLNLFYQAHPALYQVDGSWDGFAWCNADDKDNSTFSFLRSDGAEGRVMAVCNFTPNYWERYRIGIPKAGVLKEVFNSDSFEYGGSGKGNGDKVLRTEDIPLHGHRYSVEMTLPPLSCIYLELKAYKGAHPRRRKTAKP